MKHSPDIATASVGGFGPRTPRDSDERRAARERVRRAGDRLTTALAEYHAARAEHRDAKNALADVARRESSARAAPPRTSLPLTSGVSAAECTGGENR